MDYLYMLLHTNDCLEWIITIENNFQMTIPFIRYVAT